jgi:F420-non-reducing hydrogenase iron-sulfur subunit
VLVTGCHPGDCHYVQGNYMMERRYGFLREALTQLGIEPERLRLEWISAGEGEKFAALIRDATQKIKLIGPNPLKTT